MNNTKKTIIVALGRGCTLYTCTEQLSVMMGNELPVLEQIDNVKILELYETGSGECTEDIKIRIVGWNEKLLNSTTQHLKR